MRPQRRTEDQRHATDDVRVPARLKQLCLRDLSDGLDNSEVDVEDDSSR